MNTEQLPEKNITKNVSHSIDPTLQFFVSLWNSTTPPQTQEFSLILTVQGLIITGQLVSYNEYQRLSPFQKLFDELAKKDKQAEKPNKLSEPLAQHIHLKNAKFFDAAGHFMPANNDGLWRGRLSAVSGFMIGQLTPVTSETKNTQS